MTQSNQPITQKKGKRIYITREEARALSNAIDDVHGLTEAADQEYVDNAKVDVLWKFERKMARNGLFEDE